MALIGTEELRKQWLSHGYGEREFKEACRLYDPSNPSNYTCVTCTWWPLFERLYRDSLPFRHSVKTEVLDSE